MLRYCCVIPFTHVYVHEEYYATYSLTVFTEGAGRCTVRYSRYEGLSDRLTWRKTPEEVFSLDSLLNVSLTSPSSAPVTVESIKYPNRTIMYAGYLPLTALLQNPLMLTQLGEGRGDHSGGDGDYLVLAKVGGYVLTMIAHVNYGGETHDVVLDSPDYSPSNPSCLVSDIVPHRGVYVEPDWLITLKVISWILYPAMLVPSTPLTWVALGKRRGLGLVLIMTLFALSFAYVYSVITGEP